MLPTSFPRRVAIALVCTVVVPQRLAAQDLPPSILTAATCAPVPLAAPSDAPRIIGGRDTVAKALYGTNDLVVIDAGNSREIEVGQRYLVRRGVRVIGGSAPRGQDTSGALTIVAVTDQTAIGIIDLACGGVGVDDHLEPYVPPFLPPGIDRTDASGELDFTVMAHVMYGDKGRTMGAAGDFMVADIGQNKGVSPGARFGIFRDVYRSKQVPLVTLGEAVAVSVSGDHSLIRLTETRDAVVTGDLLVRRKPGPEPAPAAAAAPTAPPQTTADDDEESTPVTTTSASKTTAPARDYTFEDVHFDFDRFTLRPEALAVLDEAVAALQRDPSLRLQIEGHSCSIGTAEYNLALGARRAEAVRDHLTGRGIPPGRLTTVSYGEERPRHDNSKEETRRQNRRAALVVNLQP
ncbi:MAG TPA: OmpA family protein [Vicinamibacterales bacterium]|nr:OmpA family protein [Vicinamibacterales bacterium]